MPRIGSLDRVVAEAETRARASDLAEQFDRLRSLADGESHFLFGVIDLYQTRVTTKMTVAMERLAVIAAVTLPVTALASIYGMNVIVNDSTHVRAARPGADGDGLDQRGSSCGGRRTRAGGAAAPLGWPP